MPLGKALCAAAVNADRCCVASWGIERGLCQPTSRALRHLPQAGKEVPEQIKPFGVLATILDADPDPDLDTIRDDDELLGIGGIQ